MPCSLTLNPSKVELNVIRDFNKWRRDDRIGHKWVWCVFLMALTSKCLLKIYQKYTSLMNWVYSKSEKKTRHCSVFFINFDSTFLSGVYLEIFIALLCSLWCISNLSDCKIETWGSNNSPWRKRFTQFK